MHAKRVLLVILVASIVALAGVLGSRSSDTARALPPPSGQTSPGVTIPYPGRLSDEAGEPVIDGVYDFTFDLYEAETGGEALWSEVQEAVMVKGGTFFTFLGGNNPIPTGVLDGSYLWLAVGVRGPMETDFTALNPRQALSTASPGAPSSPTAGAACPHDHAGETWTGSNLDYLNRIENTSTGAAFYGKSQGIGIQAYSERKSAFWGIGGGSTVDHAALWINNTNSNHGMAGYLANNSDYHTAHFDNYGVGGVLFLQNDGDANGEGGSDFITAVSRDNDQQFRVISNGQARSDVGFTTPAEDFAEMLPAVEGLEPGDVLTIGPNGILTRCTEPYQASVAGVYSTQPGFLGGQPVVGEAVDSIPLALVGVVPVKASTENGTIRPGDLLVASSTPGHAMRAEPNPPQGTVIGKALEKLDASRGTGFIKMLVTLQ